MKKLCFVAALAVTLSACVSAPTKSLDPGSNLRGKHVAVSRYAKPDFTAMTAGKATFGVFGAMAMVSAGNELVKTESIEDPAIEVSDRLSSVMTEKRAAVIAPATGTLAANDSPATLVKTYPGADLILDVKTINWMYAYYPTKWSTYHVIYAARVRILDGKSGSVIAQHMCKVDPVDPDHAPSLDALRADHAALLKDFLHKAADKCADEVAQQALHA